MPNNIQDLNIVLVDVNKIIPYWRNPRRNDKTVDWLCLVIPQYGFNVPIVLDRQNVIVKGHARLRAAKRLGLIQVPCIYTDNDNETNKADRIADNKIQEMSFWDIAKLEMEYQRIGELKFDKLFHPEDISHVDFQPDQSVTFAGTSLDDYGNFMDDNADSPVYGGYSYSPSEASGGEGYQGAYSGDPEGAQQPVQNGEGEPGGGERWNPSESHLEGYESTLPYGTKALKTLCPYCGETVYIRM